MGILGTALLLCAAQASPETVELFWSGRRREAVARARAELAERPKDLELRRWLIESEIVLDHPKRALELLGPPGTWGKEVEQARGRVLYFLMRYEEAVKYLDAANDWPAMWESLVYLGREREAREMLRTIEKELGSADSAVRFLKGRCFVLEGKHAEAIPLFRALLADDEFDVAAIFALGRSLVRIGEREEGLRHLQRHRELLPLWDDYQFARKSLELNRAHAPNHARLGDAARKLGKFGEAQLAYSKATELASTEQVVPIALRYARFVAEDPRLAGLDFALQILQEAADTVDDPRLHVRAGDLLLDAGRATEALAAFERARVLRPKDAGILKRIERAREATKGDSKE